MLQKTTERETTVTKGEPKYSHAISGRTLKMPGFKVSDYFLFRSARDYFSMDMRQLFTLGLRFLYTAMHNEQMKEVLLNLATEIKNENLDIQGTKVVYTEFKDI